MKYISTLHTLALALTVPATATAQTLSVSAGFGGTKQADGNMFEIRAKTQPVVIERFDINMDVGEYPVQVYYRPGIADYRYDDSYRLAFGSNITGVGKGLVTPLPNLASSVTVFPGEPMTFYVTVASEDTTAANLWYDDGVGAGTIYASDDNINLIEGYASGYPWRAFALDRRWNGVVYYSLQTDFPTQSPSISLSTPNPTNLPTKQPTKNPVAVTNSPSSPPVGSTTPPNSDNPDSSTSSPTPAPSVLVDVNESTPPTTQTQMPTTKPTMDGSRSPTKSPTAKPTNKPSASPTLEEPDSFSPTKNVSNYLPDLNPTSSSATNMVHLLGRLCSYFTPLFIVAFFVL